MLRVFPPETFLGGFPYFFFFQKWFHRPRFQLGPQLLLLRNIPHTEDRRERNKEDKKKRIKISNGPRLIGPAIL